MGVAERFLEFHMPNKFSRVNPDHVLELHIGLDEKGRKAIELRAPFKPQKVLSSKSIEVNQYKKAEYNTIRFSLCNDEISGLFYKFCDDLIERTITANKDTGYRMIVNRYCQWRVLFSASSSNPLSESEVMGLIGEILFLRGYLREHIGLTNALNGWSGQELTHKDFSYSEDWYEVKAVSSGKSTVRISSLQQLESEKTGELVVFFLERMSEAYDGITLNKLILSTLDMFEMQDDKDKFLSKVALHGYTYNNYYDTLVYEVAGTARYIVKEGFPRLTRKDVPKQVVRAAYDLDLAQIEEFIDQE